MSEIYESPGLWTYVNYEVKHFMGGWRRDETWQKSCDRDLRLLFFIQNDSHPCLTLPFAKVSLVQTGGVIPSMYFKMDTGEWIEKKDYDLFLKCYEERRLFTMELRDTSTHAILGKYRPMLIEGIEWTKPSDQHVCLQKMKAKRVILVDL